MFLRVKKCCKKLKKIVVKCSFLNISSLGLSSRVWLNAKLDLGLDSVALAAASTMTSDKTATSLIMATNKSGLINTILHTIATKLLRSIANKINLLQTYAQCVARQASRLVRPTSD